MTNIYLQSSSLIWNDSKTNKELDMFIHKFQTANHTGVGELLSFEADKENQTERTPETNM